jgi:Fe-S cluster biogenesis protein NfuA
MAAKRVSKGRAGRARGALKRGGRVGEIRVQAASAESTLELTSENVEQVLDEVRPYLIADGGEVEVADVDALTVYLRLKGACGSCPSSAMTLKMGIERRYAFWSQETVQYLLSSLLRLFRMIRWNEMRCAHD